VGRWLGRRSFLLHRRQSTRLGLGIRSIDEGKVKNFHILDCGRTVGDERDGHLFESRDVDGFQGSELSPAD
jgi:hypothetical protein